MKMLSIAMLAMLTAVAVAKDGPRWVPGFDEPQLDTKKLTVRGPAAFYGDTTEVGDKDITGDVSVTGAITASGKITGDSIDADASNLTWTVVAAVNVTNGQVVALAAGKINMLRGTGQVDAETNTITIANFAAGDVGKITYVANAYNATNIVRIAKTGNFYGDTIELGAGDSMAIYAGTTNVLYGK